MTYNIYLEAEEILNTNLIFKNLKLITILNFEEYPCTFLYADEDKNPVIKEWVDCSDDYTTDRYFYYKPNKSDLYKYLQQSISHIELINNSIDKYVYFQDTKLGKTDFDTNTNLYIISKDNIPLTYKPKETCFFNGFKDPEILDKVFKYFQNRTYRMYGLVPYNISPIQQGIQFGHAVVEYGLKYNNTLEYKKWATNDKTFIILNGGTTNNNINNLGTLNQYRSELIDNGILIADFTEPDLGDQLTAVVFLVDDRVFDRTKWPDFDNKIVFIENKMDQVVKTYPAWKKQFDDDEKIADRIIWLREWLKNFRLA